MGHQCVLGVHAYLCIHIYPLGCYDFVDAYVHIVVCVGVSPFRESAYDASMHVVVYICRIPLLSRIKVNSFMNPNPITLYSFINQLASLPSAVTLNFILPATPLPCRVRTSSSMQGATCQSQMNNMRSLRNQGRPWLKLLFEVVENNCVLRRGRGPHWISGCGGMQMLNRLKVNNVNTMRCLGAQARLIMQIRGVSPHASQQGKFSN